MPIAKQAARVALFLLLVWFFIPLSSLAEEIPPEVQQQYQQAFDAMLEDLSNPEKSFQFVKLATRVGDLRGAIAALERILLVNPDLANIQLELGVLYLRAGNAALARDFLRKAIQAPAIPDAIRTRAERFLLIAEGGLRRHIFNGTVFLGGRYDTNANAAPTGREVLAGGGEALLDEGSLGRDDFSLVNAGNFRYIYALGDQGGSEIETNLLLYSQRYARSNEINLGTVGWDVGPRFYLGPVLDPAISIRPFGSFTYLWLGDEQFLATYGGGLDFRRFFTETLYGDARIAVSQQDYKDSSLRPFVSQRTGPLAVLDGILTYQWRPGTRFSGRLVFSRRDSREDFESFFDGGAALSVTHDYTAPFDLTSYGWSSSFSLGFRFTSYDKGDPLIDANIRRMDPRTDIIFSTNARVTEALTVVWTVQYTNNNSNLPNFKFTNTGITLGFAYRFGTGF